MVVGIVAEYNPFHNGHKFHIETAKRELGAECAVAVMSGNFIQRGGAAVFDMYERAGVAVLNGVDLVLSLAPRYALKSAQFYAENAVHILNSLGGVNYLSFGSECGDLGALSKAALEKPSKAALKQGKSYAASFGSDVLSRGPNNILGVEYLRALKKLDSPIIPHTVKREGAGHNGSRAVGDFASASFIRNILKNGGDISRFAPGNKFRPRFAEELGQLLSYRLNLGDPDRFADFSNISEGLNNRILKYKDCRTIDGFAEKIKCKRYTETRVHRALYSILLDIKGENELPDYTRVLAANETGRAFLRRIKGGTAIKIYSRITYKDITDSPQLRHELFCNNLYAKL